MEDVASDLERELNELDETTTDSQQKLNKKDLDKLHKQKEALKNALTELRSKINTEKRKANAAIEKRGLITESLDNAREYQKKFQNNLRIDTLPLEPASVQNIIQSLAAKQEELTTHQSGQKEKFQQLKKPLDQSKEPYSEELSLANEVFEEHLQCSQIVANQIKDCELALKQRKELLGTLDSIEDWLVSSKEFMKDVDVGEICEPTATLDKLKVCLKDYGDKLLIASCTFNQMFLFSPQSLLFSLLGTL